MQDIERIFADMKKEIAEESKEEVNAILADVKKSEDDALVTMQQEAKKNADLRLKQELEEMHSEAATEISQVNSERMKKLIEKRDEYVNTIFTAVEASDRIQLGGLIVEDKLSALVVNETLDEALKAQHEWFNKNSGLVIK